MVPRKGLEPPRSYSLVPETSASTNSATWASQERGDCIKNISQTSGLLDEVEGTIQGHRDGHGFVSRDDGEATSICRPTRCAPCCTRTASRCASCAATARAGPRGGSSRSSSGPPAHHRPAAAGGRCLAGRARGQALRAGRADPQGRHRHGQAGQVVVVELVEPPASMASPSGASRRCWARSTTPAWRSRSRCASTACRMSSPTPASRWRARCPTRCVRRTRRTGST
jgi:hypothetical protein